MDVDIALWQSVISTIKAGIDVLRNAKDLLPEGVVRAETKANLAKAERDLQMAQGPIAK